MTDSEIEAFAMKLLTHEDGEVFRTLKKFCAHFEPNGTSMIVAGGMYLAHIGSLDAETRMIVRVAASMLATEITRSARLMGQTENGLPS